MRVEGRNFILDGEKPVCLSFWEREFILTLFYANREVVSPPKIPRVDSGCDLHSSVEILRRKLPHGHKIIEQCGESSYRLCSEEVEMSLKPVMEEINLSYQIDFRDVPIYRRRGDVTRRLNEIQSDYRSPRKHFWRPFNEISVFIYKDLDGDESEYISKIPAPLWLLLVARSPKETE